MNIGIIFECQKDGPDVQVCTELARRINDKVVLSPVTLGSKKKLIADCGKAAKKLLDDGCERVIIIWDLRPPHPLEEKLDCVRECNAVKESLTAAQVDQTKISLISIREELESWFCADRQTLVTMLSTEAHAAEVPKFKKPEKVTNPKAQFVQMFKSSPRYKRRYLDMTDAVRIARECDLTKLARVQSFARFRDRII